jgi:superfamily II DNA or RNA helicase
MQPLKPQEDYARLVEENARLKDLLRRHGIDSATPPENPPARAEVATSSVTQITHRSPEENKVALFRGFFKGRDDVYALRWEARGKTGYSPACIRNWRAILKTVAADRKRVDRESRRLLPLTDEAIREHLLGKQTIGLYPLLTDETCWFLAVDFDKKSWQEDSAAFLRTCNLYGVPAALERSRSGNGGHVWIFFSRPVAAAAARRMGCAFLTQSMDVRHSIGLDSYDRLFPNQDTMPRGGFGNLIALPLQGVPRKNGNSVFVDSSFNPLPDQWTFLSSVQRMEPETVDLVVKDATRAGQIIGIPMSIPDDEFDEEPWRMPPSKRHVEKPILDPLPERVQVVRSNLVYVEKKGLPPAMLNRIVRLAAFQNPEFYKAQAMRLSTFDKPRVISCADDLTNHVALPRGCLDQVLDLMKAHGVKTDVRDERFAGVPLEIGFRGQLRPSQEDAVAQIIKQDNGILCAPTAFGKTATAAWLIAARKVNTLVLVHRRQLLDQWRERLAMFLDLPSDSIGQVGGGRTKRTGSLDVAVIQSLQRKGEVLDLVAEYGHVIIDECHHLSAFSFEQVLKQARARYILGLTATPVRKDGHHPIIYMQCGPVRFALTAKQAADASPFEHQVLVRETDFLFLDSGEVRIHDLYEAIATCQSRNEQIAADVIEAVRAGRSPLLLTARTRHLDWFAERLAGSVKNIHLLKGGMGRKQRRASAEALAGVPPEEGRVILATGSYIGEGFDDARLDTLFLATPISWRGTLQQYVGRLHRLHDGKRIVRVYDYVDAAVPMLARMFEKRVKGYQMLGYVVAPSVEEKDGSETKPAKQSP